MDAATARGRFLGWLAQGAQDLTWALCSLPRERWLSPPPAELDSWSAARHVRHVALREARVTLPAVRFALGDLSANHLVPVAELLPSEDLLPTEESVSEHIRALGEARFELLQRLESAPDDAWDRPLPVEVSPLRTEAPVGLGWLLARSYQHELAHLGALWRLVLYWDGASLANELSVSLPLHPADRPEESH